MGGVSLPPNWDDPPTTDRGEWAVEFVGMMPHVEGVWADKDKVVALYGEDALSEETRGDDSGIVCLRDTWHAFPDRTRWQRTFLRHVFGTLDEDDHRVIHSAYMEIAKKNGKTTLAAAVGNYLTFGDGEEGAEVYSAAYDKGQAKIAWRKAVAMIRKLPWLKRRAHIKEGLGNEVVEFPATNSFYQPLARDDDASEGINPHGIIFDELHTQPDPRFWKAMEDATVSRLEPILLALTFAGYDRESVCYRQHEYTRKVNRGEIEKPSHFGVIFAINPETDDWTDPEVWGKANPNLDVSVPRKRLSESVAKAQEIPSEQNIVKRKHFNVWTQQVTRWLDPDDWEGARDDYTEKALEGRQCFGGLDLGSVYDLSAWVLAFPWDDKVRFLCRAWCPEARLHDRSNPYAEQYQAWVRDGWMTEVEGEVMDTEPVEDQIVADAERFGMVDMAMDRKHQGIDLSVRLVNHHGLDVAGMGSGYRSMSAPCTELERRLKSEPPLVRHDGNPVLAWSVGNVALYSPDDDRKKPVKDTDEAKIDPVVALLMAFSRAMEHTAGKRSPYESEDAELFVL